MTQALRRRSNQLSYQLALFSQKTCKHYFYLKETHNLYSELATRSRRLWRLVSIRAKVEQDGAPVGGRRECTVDRLINLCSTEHK